jgi:hypothetical protein
MMRIEDRMLRPLRLAGAWPSGIAGAICGDTIFADELAGELAGELPGDFPREFPVDK